MKLIGRRNVFLASNDRASGHNANFSIQIPSDFSYNPNYVYRMHVSSVHLRNSFFGITDRNCQYYICVQSYTKATPAPPTIDNLGPWLSLRLPKGCLTDIDIVAAIHQQLLLLPADGTTDVGRSLAARYRFGRLMFAGTNTVFPFYAVHLYFGPGVGTGSAHQQFGFPEQGQYVMYPCLTPTERGDPVDDSSETPPEASMSPGLIHSGQVSDVLLVTSLPNNNYEVSNSADKSSVGASLTRTTTSIPVLTPPGGSIVWSDVTGVNSIFQYALEQNGPIIVSLQDKYKRELTPVEDWTMTLTVETLEDVEKQYLKYMTTATEHADENNTLLKMMLLKDQLATR